MLRVSANLAAQEARSERPREPGERLRSRRERIGSGAARDVHAQVQVRFHIACIKQKLAAPAVGRIGRSRVGV